MKIIFLVFLLANIFLLSIAQRPISPMHGADTSKAGFAVGNERTIGFFGSFLISLVFSPVIGLLASLQYDII